MNICKVRFSLYQLLIFLIFLSYIFLDKEIAKKKKKKKFYPWAAHDYFLFHPAGG